MAYINNIYIIQYYYININIINEIFNYNYIIY